MKTIRQIWGEVSGHRPFAVRLKYWGKDTYAVIIKFGPYMNQKNPDPNDLLLMDHPVGIPLTNDKPNFVIVDSFLFQKHSMIPRHDYPEWELVTDIDLTRFERVDIHSLNNVMHFGKHTAREIKDIINSDKKYIFWLINHFPKFALGDDAIKYLQDNFANEIESGMIELNKQKCVWLQNGQSDETFPAIWKYSQTEKTNT